jgi:cytoplasmic tRNA 2-thiolation protein 2
VSSTALLHLLNENVEFQLAKGRNAPFELVVIHIDASDAAQQPSPPAETALACYRARYPRFTFHCIPLSAALTTTTTTQTTPQPPNPNPATILPSLITPQQTAASRTDLLTQLTRRALLAQASLRDCQALLLGHSTTALAELTLAEAAKGRGFAVPWLVGDGVAPSVPDPAVFGGGGEGGLCGSGNGVGGSGDGKESKPQPVLVYHPLRDALRKELVIYAGLVDPPLTDLVQTDNGRDGNRPVVSHKDLSIEEVMTRYFAEVEESYPSVVANVARTTGKLERAGCQAGAECGLCGMPLDEDGDERWRGELNIQEGPGTASGLGSLCYGCERSTGG